MKATKPICAADIMQRDLIVARPSDSLRQALDLMTENHVTGLPVVDAHSRCVGVISATDILNYEQEQVEYASSADDDGGQHFNMDTQRWESVRVSSFALEEYGDVRVDEVMSPGIVSVNRNTPLSDIAKTMMTNRIHRVLVMDSRQRLYGIISATDFVRIFANHQAQG
jgi:CBS domain-containing protein